MPVQESLHVEFDSGELLNLFFKKTCEILAPTFLGKKQDVYEIEKLLRSDNFYTHISKEGNCFSIKAGGPVNIEKKELQHIISGKIKSSMVFESEFPQNVVIQLIIENVLSLKNIPTAANLSTPVRNISFTPGSCKDPKSGAKIIFDFSLVYESSDDHK
jgi:hypothetical protein